MKTPVSERRTNPLRKARSLLRKSGRPAAVAFLKAEVEEMAEVSPEMAEGIASDALDGNEEVLLAILDLIEDALDADSAPAEEEMAPIDEAPAEEPIGEEPMEEEPLPEANPGEGQVPPSGGPAAGVEMEPNAPPEVPAEPIGSSPSRHMSPGDGVSPDEPDDPDKMMKAGSRHVHDAIRQTIPGQDFRGRASRAAMHGMENAEGLARAGVTGTRPMSLHGEGVGGALADAAHAARYRATDRAASQTELGEALRHRDQQAAARSAGHMLSKSAGRASASEPASNLDPMNSGSSPARKPSEPVPVPPQSHGSPVVGQLERAPKQSELESAMKWMGRLAKIQGTGTFADLAHKRSPLSDMVGKLGRAARVAQKPAALAGRAAVGVGAQGRGMVDAAMQQRGGHGFVPKTPFATPPSAQKWQARMAKSMRDYGSDEAKGSVPKPHTIDMANVFSSKDGAIPKTPATKPAPTRAATVEEMRARLPARKAYGGSGYATRQEANPLNAMDGRGDTMKALPEDVPQPRDEPLERELPPEPPLTQWDRDALEYLPAEGPHPEEYLTPQDTELGHIPFRAQVPGVGAGSNVVDDARSPRMQGSLSQQVGEMLEPRLGRSARLNPPVPEPTYEATLDPSQPRSAITPFERFQAANKAQSSHLKWTGRLVKGDAPPAPKADDEPTDAAQRAWKRREAKLPDLTGKLPGVPDVKPAASPSPIDATPVDPKPEDFASPAAAEPADLLPDFARHLARPAAPAPTSVPQKLRRGRPRKWDHLGRESGIFSLPRLAPEDRPVKPDPNATESRLDIAGLPEERLAVNRDIQRAVFDLDYEKLTDLVVNKPTMKDHIGQLLWRQYEHTFDPGIEDFLVGVIGIPNEVIQSRKEDLISPFTGVPTRKPMRIPRDPRNRLPPGFETFSKEEAQAAIERLKAKLAGIPIGPRSGKRQVPKTGMTPASINSLVSALERHVRPESGMQEKFDPAGRMRMRTTQWNRPKDVREARQQWTSFLQAVGKHDVEEIEAALAGGAISEQNALQLFNWAYKQTGDPDLLFDMQRLFPEHVSAISARPAQAPNPNYTLEQAVLDAIRFGQGATKAQSRIWKAMLGQSLVAGESAVSKHKFAGLGAKEPTSPSERPGLHHTQKSVLAKLISLADHRRQQRGGSSHA